MRIDVLYPALMAAILAGGFGAHVYLLCAAFPKPGEPRKRPGVRQFLVAAIVFAICATLVLAFFLLAVMWSGPLDDTP